MCSATGSEDANAATRARAAADHARRRSRPSRALRGSPPRGTAHRPRGEERAVARHLPVDGDVRRHNGNTGRETLEQRQVKTLVAAGLNENGGMLIEPAELRVVDLAEPPDRRAHAVDRAPPATVAASRSGRPGAAAVDGPGRGGRRRRAAGRGSCAVRGCRRGEDAGDPPAAPRRIRTRVRTGGRSWSRGPPEDRNERSGRGGPRRTER